MRCCAGAAGADALEGEWCEKLRTREDRERARYQELAFHLEDSASFRAFARLPWGWSSKNQSCTQDDQGQNKNCSKSYAAFINQRQQLSRCA